MEDKDFKKKFPKLAAEMDKGVSKADVKFRVKKPKPSTKFAGHDPNAIDFIRRCKTEDQAYEIIEYLEKKGEITKEQAEDLSKKLKEEGLKCFGPRKEHGYYDKEGR